MVSPIYTLLEMIWLLLSNGVTTIIELLRLFGRLVSELFAISAAGGPLGIGASIAIIAIVGFLIARYIMKAEKLLIILVIVGLIVLWIFVLGVAG